MTNFLQNSIFRRVLLLYGVYMLMNNSDYLLGYYLLPEGCKRGSPQTAAGRLVDTAGSFGVELFLTLVFNLGMVVVMAILMNLNQV